MRTGFFPDEELATKVSPVGTSAQCSRCRLYANGCKTPKMPVHGEGRKGIMVLGEGPGKIEDQLGRPFVGPAGRELRLHLSHVGVDLDRDCWSTNSVICRTTTKEIGNDPPTDRQVEFCRPNVANAIARLKPKVVILLGKYAIDSVIGWLWKPNPGDVTRWAGWKIPSQEINAWVCPTYHPSWVHRSKEKQDYGLVSMLFRQHLEAAVGMADKRPWDKVPSYERVIHVVTNPGKVVAALAIVLDGVDRFAFDFETNMLKPDNESGYIYCCSVSDGNNSIAFPWQGEVVEYMTEILSSPRLGKIGANCKYEHRWVRSKLGIHVRNWVWDTMVAAHVLDNRKGVAGLKFLSFVHFGLGDYDSSVSPYLKGKTDGGYAPNRVKEAPQHKLMVYNAMDSLMTYKLAMIQSRELGMEDLLK